MKDTDLNDLSVAGLELVEVIQVLEQATTRLNDAAHILARFVKRELPKDAVLS